MPRLTLYIVIFLIPQTSYGKWSDEVWECARRFAMLAFHGQDALDNQLRAESERRNAALDFESGINKSVRNAEEEDARVKLAFGREKKRRELFRTISTMDTKALFEAYQEELKSARISSPNITAPYPGSFELFEAEVLRNRAGVEGIILELGQH